MRRKILFIILGFTALACDNLVQEEYSLIFTTEEPNLEFAKKLEEVLENTWNVDIILSEAKNVQQVVDNLSSEKIDMGLVENLVNVGDGIHTVVPIFPKVLHLFYKKELAPTSIESLFYDHTVYAGREGSATYGFLMDLFAYYQLDTERIKISADMMSADVVAIFSVILNQDQIDQFRDYNLFSISGESSDPASKVEGLALRFPRVRPFVIPEGTYDQLTPAPIYTIASDMVFVVREGMGSIAVNDLTSALFLHREQFVHVHPSFYFGIIENFDRSRLSYSLHEGARAYFDRDQPSFFERYAELVGVIFTISLALGSGLISLGKRRKRKKKDKIDIFYEHLMKIKNEMPQVSSVVMAREKIQEVKDEQDRAFKMLIDEELEANESFRIYMELSKETIDDLRLRLRQLKSHENQG